MIPMVVNVEFTDLPLPLAEEIAGLENCRHVEPASQGGTTGQAAGLAGQRDESELGGLRR